MARPHIEFIQSADVPEEEIGDGILAGAFRRLLSEDDADGSWTGLVRLPAGSAVDLAASTRAIELFGLRGLLNLAGAAFAPGSYSYVPASPDDASMVVS